MAARTTGIRSSGCARWSSATRSRSSAAACTSRSSCRCPSAIGLGQLTRMRDEIAARFGVAPRGAWLAERVWEPSLPFDLADGRLRVHRARRQPPARRVRGRGRDVGHVHDRRPGPAADHLRHGEGSALPHPVAAGRRADRLPARQRDRRRRAGRDHGRRRREVRRRGRARTSCAGRKEQWVERCFEALEDNCVMAVDGHAVRWMAAHPPHRSDLHPDVVVRRDDRVGAAGRRAAALPRGACSGRSRSAPAEARFLRGALWRNFQARYREINDLHKQMLRVSDGCRRDARRCVARAGRSTTCTAASRTTATGTAGSAASTSSTCAWPRSPS